MKALLVIFLTTISLNADAFFGFRDKPEVESVVEVHINKPARLIPGSIIEPVWKEAKSNDNLTQYTVRVILNGFTDKYGNEISKDIGSIIFNESIIAEIRKYKRSSPFYGSRNEVHQWVLREFMALDK